MCDFKAKAAWLLTNGYWAGECLECHLQPVIKGYSYVSFSRIKRERAHRVVFFADNPTADRNLHVLHTCDNRRCINPKHLFLGTPQDNTNDMIQKGRKVDDPEVGHRRKIATANMIRPLYQKGYSNVRIARQLHLSPTTIGNYVNGAYREYLCPVTISARDEGDVCVG